MDEERTQLEERVQYGLHGAPELKKAERARYLGEFRERVLIALTLRQVEEPGVYPEVLQAFHDPRASQLILRRDVSLERASDYIELAQQQKIAFKRVDSPTFKGDIALVVVSTDAVDVPRVLVEERAQRLMRLGFTDTFIQAVGSKLCPACWKKLETLYPEELINYRRITWVDSLLGERCTACQSEKKMM